MVPFFTLSLLAAYFTVVIAGPLPHLRHLSSVNPEVVPIVLLTKKRSPYYTNTSSTSIPLFFEAPKSTSVATPSSVTQNVEADTAVVIEPVDRTMFTQTQPAITFVDPDGTPMATQPEETVFSTSFITKPTSIETPAPKTSPASSNTTPVDTSVDTLSSLQPTRSSGNSPALPLETLLKSMSSTGSE